MKIVEIQNQNIKYYGDIIMCPNMLTSKRETKEAVNIAKVSP
jgi:hypothetical protein